MDFIVDNQKIVTLKFKATPVKGNKYYLPVDSELSNGIITGLSIPYGVALSTSYNVGQALTLISGSQITNFFLTLVNKKGEIIINYLAPYTFVPTYNNGQIRRFSEEDIDLAQSYIVFNDVTGITTATGILFNFYYHK